MQEQKVAPVPKKMKLAEIRNQVMGQRGNWITVSDQIDIHNVQKRNIYRADMEPSFVCWAILWKESDGALKLTFTETTGAPETWPPTYNFNEGDFDWYRKTLVSHDDGETWKDTGWKGPLDSSYWDLNSHHLGYHTFERQDGVLVRLNPRGVKGNTEKKEWMYYDESKAMEDFPFSMGETEVHRIYTAIRTSTDKGRSWEEIYINMKDSRFWATCLHQLKNGSMIAIGGNGIQNDKTTLADRQVVLTESLDGGYTWCDLQIIADNDDLLALQDFSEEHDFVELDDGRLLLIMRAGGVGMYQMYLTRDDSDKWHATEPISFKEFVPSGYPYMHKASDGTIFYYDDTAIRYTCDEGTTWNSLPLGFAYYGQLLETRPGRILAVTQMNIGDCPYPWKHDTAMQQNCFDYERIGVVEQIDSAAVMAVGVLEGQYSDFHMYAEIRADGETGIAFDVTENGYGFAAVVIPFNEFRAPGRASKEQRHASLVLGRCESGKVTLSRKVGLGKVVPGSWVEIQVNRCEGLLKAAVKTREGDWMTGQMPAAYLTMRCPADSSGKLGFFTNRSTGAFKNVRIGDQSEEIRSNWRTSDEGVRRIALDAGKQN